MQEKDIAVKDLALAIGMSQRTIYNIFENRKCPTIAELEKFADALDVNIEELYEVIKEK